MTTAEYLPSNNLFILIAVLLVAVAMLAYFMRKRSNRHPMDTPRGREIEAMRRDETLQARKRVNQPPR